MLLGMWAKSTVTLTAFNDSAAFCDSSARGAVAEVACGTHNRFIGGIDNSAQRLKAK